MKGTALAITSILLILAIAWKMSDGPKDATIREQTHISALSQATKTNVAKEPQSESVSRVTDTFKIVTSESIDYTNLIETKNPKSEDSLSTGLQKVHTEMERNVMAMVNAEMQNPHFEIGESLVGGVSLEADFAREIIKAFKLAGMNEMLETNAWELSLPSDSSTDMHFVKELGIHVEKEDTPNALVKVTIGYE